MAITNEQFVQMANPHSWFLVADNLHAQAVALRNTVGQSLLTFRDIKVRFEESWDATNRSVFLISGFALENALKAFLVYENPGWISNGTLSRKLRSHSLTGLSQLSTLVPYKNRSQSILRGFEDGLESWARYPCSLSKEDAKKEQLLSEKLWKGYEWLVPAYGRKLRNLLSKEWRGPHGFHGSYKIKGSFLGAS